MEIVRWNPFDELMSWWPRDLLARLQSNTTANLQWSPRCDVRENESEIVVHAELPGIEAHDIDVSVRDGTLTLRGDKRSEHVDSEATRTHTERFFGSFERTLAIPVSVDRDAIRATLKDGVLEVRVPKRQPEEAPIRKIQIEKSP